MGPLGGKDAIPRVTKACRTPRDSHILPIVVPTLPRPTMVTVSAPEDDASARHLAGDILDTLRPRHDRPTATRAGEPAADIGRARACGPRKSRKGAHPSSSVTHSCGSGRPIAPLAPKMRPEFQPVTKPRLGASNTSATEGHRPVAPCGVQVIDQHRARLGVVRSKRGRTRARLPRLGFRAGKTGSLTHTRERSASEFCSLFDGGSGREGSLARLG